MCLGSIPAVESRLTCRSRSCSAVDARGISQLHRRTIPNTEGQFRNGVMALNIGHNLWDGTSRRVELRIHGLAATVPFPRLRAFGWFLQLPVWRLWREPRS